MRDDSSLPEFCSLSVVNDIFLLDLLLFFTLPCNLKKVVPLVHVLKFVFPSFTAKVVFEMRHKYDVHTLPCDVNYVCRYETDHGRKC